MTCPCAGLCLWGSITSVRPRWVSFWCPRSSLVPQHSHGVLKLCQCSAPCMGPTWGVKLIVNYFKTSCMSLHPRHYACCVSNPKRKQPDCRDGDECPAHPQCSHCTPKVLCQPHSCPQPLLGSPAAAGLPWGSSSGLWGWGDPALRKAGSEAAEHRVI